MKLNEFEAVIFDCDGVLVNSEAIIQDIELAHLANCGVHYQRAGFCRRYTGLSDAAFFSAINQDSLDQTGTKLPDDFIEHLEAEVKTAFQSGLRAVDGALQLIQHLSATARAVASSSQQDHLNAKLEQVGLLELFGGHVYSADAVSAGKPAPDLFRHTALQLGVNSRDCVVIEDSINGVLAGCRAGMTVVGFSGGGHCLDGHDKTLRDAGASWVVSHFDQLTP